MLQKLLYCYMNDDSLISHITPSFPPVQTPPDLIAQLSSDDLEPLANSLADREPTVRAAAATAIASLGVADVVELLERPMYSDSNAEVRCDCARALGKVGTPEAVDVLVAALVNSDEILLACISDVLEGLGYRLG
jgi:HEAT repeat protein